MDGDLNNMTMQERFMEIQKLNQAIKDTTYSFKLQPDEEQRISSIISNGGLHLKNFKPENRTYPVCLAAVMKDGMAIEFVPVDLHLKEIYYAACKSDGRALGKIPEKFRTAALCKVAIIICPIR